VCDGKFSIIRSNDCRHSFYYLRPSTKLTFSWFVPGHPFILFYTERILKSLSIKPKPRNGQVDPVHQIVSTSLPESDRRRPSSGSLSQGSSSVVTSKRRVTDDSEKQDDCGLIDALTVAISQVTLSKPKRSRLCGTGSTIQQQYSANSLCEAF